MRPTRFAAAIVAMFAIACGAFPQLDDMNFIAEQYVKLVLDVGQHDKDFVDAYYGEPRWKPVGAPMPLEQLRTSAADLREHLASQDTPRGTMEQLRRTYLDKQLSAVQTRIAMLLGERLSFDNEAARLYDATPPHLTEQDFQPTLDELDRLLPGTGPLIDRYAKFREAYVIPRAKLDAVFQAAIDGCRARTLAHVSLPPEESFTIEYVTGKTWSAYNWYKGGYASLIQVNTDIPNTIDRALDLACHEGYPGHHVYNALLEKNLVRDRGWVEFSIYPLFSPQSLIAEGTANFGIEVAFPGDERTAFERQTLYPLAGLNPASAEAFTRVQHAVAKLSYAGNEAARRYLNGEIDRAAAAAYLQRYAMTPKDRAEQRIGFFDQYRSYVINYNLGQDLVRAFVEAQGGGVDHPDARWKIFTELLSSPRLPSGLK